MTQFRRNSYWVAAVLVHAAPAYAITGNFLPEVLSILVFIPALLLVPAIAIARSAHGWDRKRPWLIASLLVALLSFGWLWWTIQTYHLMAGRQWGFAYLWAIPPYLLWFAFRAKVTSTPK